MCIFTVAMQAELRDILFLDIETVRGYNQYTALPERLQVQWQRKAAYLKREPEHTDEELYHERAAIYAEFGRVVCVSVGKLYDTPDGLGLKTKTYVSESERDLLQAVADLFSRLEPGTRLCAHNGKEFDFPYLSRRMLVQSLPLPEVLNLAGKRPWEVPHLDTLELWKFGDYKHYTALDLLATLFDIPTSKGDMDGSRVSEVFYSERDLEKIGRYCAGDVAVVAQLYLRMKGYPLMSPEAIIHG